MTPRWKVGKKATGASSRDETMNRRGRDVSAPSRYDLQIDFSPYRDNVPCAWTRIKSRMNSTIIREGR